MSKTVHTVIVGHGQFPQGLLSAAEGIVGKQEGVVCVSNKNLSIESITANIEEQISDIHSQAYVFVDLIGGSCFTACRALIPNHPQWIIIAGVNLPMLVTYLSYRSRLSGDNLVCKTLESARRGIEVLTPGC